MKTCVIFAVVTYALAAHLPPELKTCRRSSPDFNECLAPAVTSAFKKLANGNADLKIPPIDLVNIPEVSVGKGTGPVQVVQNYKNVKMHDLSSCEFKSVKVTITDKQYTIEGTAHVDHTKLEGEYGLDGNILVLPVKGSGPYTVILKDVTVDLTMTGDIFQKKGKDYVEFKTFSGRIKPNEMHLGFENLFNGDKALGDEMNKVLNDNWKEIFADVEQGYVAALGVLFKDYANRLFKKVPLDEIHPL